MKNKIMKNLILATAFAILFTSANAFAYVPGVWDPQPHMFNNDKPAFVSFPDSTTPAPAPVVIAPKPTPKVTPAPKPIVIQPVQYVPATTNDNVSTLGASAGSLGFMPHTVFQWILVIFLILIIIIIARKLQKPAKHEEESTNFHARTPAGAH